MEILQLATPEDHASVASITRQVHELHVKWRPDIFRSAEDVYPEEYFLEDILEKLLYVAKRNDKVIGYVRFFLWETNSEGSIPTKVLDIDDITIDEDYRHQGIGKIIMEDLKEIAKERGCHDIQLSVYPQNESAVRFYEKCGFKVRNIRYQMYL